MIEPEELGKLLDSHGGALVCFARQWCNSAEDIVQNALLQLMREKRVPENPVAWLYRVVRNGAIDAARSQQRRRRRETYVAQSRTNWFLPALGHGLDAAAAVAALEQLPLEQREVIVARIWSNLTFQELAELTGTSLATVHRRYESGFAQLRVKLNVDSVQ